MKRLILIPILIANLTACNESGSPAAFVADESPSSPPVSGPTPTPTPPAAQGACYGDYLVGTWTYTPSAHNLSIGQLPQTYIINEDCEAENIMCEFDFEVPPFGYTAEYSTGYGWDGNYNFRVRHLNAPNINKPGCMQFQNVITPWHNCNLFAVDNNTLELDCNGPASNNGNGTNEPGRVTFIRQ